MIVTADMPNGTAPNGNYAKDAKVNGQANGEARNIYQQQKRFVPGQGESFEVSQTHLSTLLTVQEAKARYAKLIRQEDVDHWEKHGFVIIEKFLSPEEMSDLTEGIYEHMPTYDEFKKDGLVYKKTAISDRIGMGGGSAAAMRYDFPYDNDSMNELAMHPFLFAFAERLAGTDDLALSNGHLIGKYAGHGDYEQQLHSDLMNNTFVVPCRDKRWIDIPIIVYLTDVTIDLGPTYVVSQTHTDHRNLVEDGLGNRDPKLFPELYENEIPAVVPAGSVIIYSMRTFHRGSAMKAKEGTRFVQFSGFHSANVPWMAPMDQQHKMGSKEMNRFLLHADPRQRQIVGFPPVDSEYWKDPLVVEGVANRYPTMDMRPYGGGPPKKAAA